MTLRLETADTKEIIVQILENNKIIDSLTTEQQTGSQAVLPMIVQILKKNKVKISDIKSVEVDTGPGSFTGTRIGVTIANALGFALKIPVNGGKAKIALPKYQKSKFD